MNASGSQKKKSTVSRGSRQSDSRHCSPYPFSAIVGQEEMKLALILNVIDPLIGGVLIMGHRGTGKSTAVRALADLLPQISTVVGCVYKCDPKDQRSYCPECRARLESGTKPKRRLESIPVVELPLGATEDRVCGTIAIERALREGVKTFEPGLLARANRGFLYIDEVNLLEDHLVDLLLDVAVTGLNKVEREGVSIEHPASFVLIGSGNPEEGELRPQLLDRFGLHAQVTTEDDLNQRVAVVERCEAYDRDPEAFRRLFAASQDDLRERITYARQNFTKVKVDRSTLRQIAQLCIDLKADGHRGELTIMRAARALAAFQRRKRVTEDDVKAVAVMSLRHRLRRNALEETASGDRIEQALDVVFSDGRGSGERTSQSDSPKSGQQKGGRQKTKNASAPPDTGGDGGRNASPEFPSPPPANHSSKLRMGFDLTRAKNGDRSQTGRSPVGRKRTLSSHTRGRHSRSVVFNNSASKVALAATLRALVAYSVRSAGSAPAAESNNGCLTPVETNSLRYKLFSRKQGTLFIFAIDASGSMARNRIALAKRVMLDRLRQSYVSRDSIAIVSFRGDSAGVALPPSRSIVRARRVLDSLRVGGSTPLSAGLACAIELVEAVADKCGEIVVLLFTDGQSNVPLRNKNGSRGLAIETELSQLSAAMKRTRAKVVVVDTKHEFESSEESKHLAELLQGRFVKIRAGL